MAKQTISLNFEGADMKDVVRQMVEFLQSVGVFNPDRGEKANDKTEES